MSGRLFNASERALEGLDNGYRRLLHRALMHRPTVIGLGVGLFVAAILILPSVGVELMPQTDEGEVRVDAELAVGTRIERTEAVMIRLEELVKDGVPEAETVITSAGGGGGWGGNTHRGQMQIRLVGRSERERSNDQIAQDLRRRLSGLPGVIIRARPAGGNGMLNRLFGGTANSRLALEIRGYDLDDARQLSERAKTLMEGTPGIADVRIAREEGRPELAVHVDRPKAALLGLTVTEVANTIRTNIGGTQAAFYRERGNEYPIIVRLRIEDRGRISDVNDVLIGTTGGQVLPAKNLMNVQSQSGPVQIQRKNQERITQIEAENEVTLSEAVNAVQSKLPELGVPPDFSAGFGTEVEETAKSFAQLRLMLILAIVLVYAVMASQYESLRDPFIIMFSIPLAAIGVVLSLKLTGTPFQPAGLHRRHHAGGHCGQQRHPARGLHQRSEAAGWHRPSRGGGNGRAHQAAAHHHDHVDHDSRPRADVAGHRRRQRAAGASCAGGHRWPADLHAHHAGVRPDDVHDFRGRLPRCPQERDSCRR